jgi:hypothetical protein
MSIAALLSLTLAAGGANGQLAKGTRAPDFEIAKAWNGGPTSFKDLAGRVVLLDLFATW